ncbi:hypothetical protein F7D01_07340 [Erythrobacter sp. 3-20A1M]|nr:hypothetical protein F7D01_07340 [Erythrobacter sp. 3-20A1M]
MDCEAVAREIYACVGDDADRITSCIPFSRPARLSGVWTSDFEHNVFFEDDASESDMDDLARFERYVVEYPELTGAGEALRSVKQGKDAVIVHLSFIGRRPLCDPIHSRPWILVDKVISHRILEKRPPGAITWDPDNAKQ